jgi:hypothetical protein
MIAGGASIVVLMLPRKNSPFVEVDEEVAETMAEVVQRMKQRGMTWSERGLSTREIGCIDMHRASGASVQRRLRSKAITDCTVSTPELWQGLERPLMVVKHPLSGIARPEKFSLDAGRWCVMLSRHKLACVVVGREGIDESLSDYQHDSCVTPCGADDVAWRGWQAHWSLWQQLTSERRIVKMAA